MIIKAAYKKLNEILSGAEEAQKALVRIFEAIDKYNCILTVINYAGWDILKKINDSVYSEYKNKLEKSLEAVDYGIDLFLSSLGVDSDYNKNISSFKNMILKITSFSGKYKLSRVFFKGKLFHLSVVIEIATEYFDEKIKEKFLPIHNKFVRSITKLRELVIVYNRIKPTKEAYELAEALSNLKFSSPDYKKDIINELIETELSEWEKV